MKIITELPHAVYDLSDIKSIDFRIEKLPISRDRKNQLTKDFISGKGIIGKMPKSGKLIKFTPQGLTVIHNKPNKKMLSLPDNWNDYALILKDHKSRIKEVIRTIVKEILLEEQKYELYCDMDGVLTDFDKALLSVGIKDGRKWEADHGSAEFWKKIDGGGLKYWSEMSWLSDGKALWNFIKKLNPTILSAPARSIPNSKKGKKIWVKRELGNVPVILKRARNKKDLADKNSIMIDDTQTVIDGWTKAGGIGILHKSAAQTIKKLKELGIN